MQTRCITYKDLMKSHCATVILRKSSSADDPTETLWLSTSFLKFTSLSTAFSMIYKKMEVSQILSRSCTEQWRSFFTNYLSRHQTLVFAGVASTTRSNLFPRIEMKAQMPFLGIGWTPPFFGMKQPYQILKFHLNVMVVSLLCDGICTCCWRYLNISTMAKIGIGANSITEAI